MKEYPQGSTIRFRIKFKDSNTSPTITSFDDVVNVVALVYTCDNNIPITVKFSKVLTSGYNTLYRIDSKTLLGVIKSTQTKLMLGDLLLEQKIEMNLELPEPPDTGISPIIETSIIIVESLISKIT